MSYRLFLETLEARLKGSLPGLPAQELMAPRPRRQWPDGFKTADLRHAAGLLLLYPLDDRPHLVLTVRSEAVRHAGQVSLPGGVIEDGETVEQAALREAQEEIGVDPATIRTLGLLTPIDIPVSGFRLHPVVAATDVRPTLRAADDEVAQILEVSSEALVDPANLGAKRLVRDGLSLECPAFTTHGVVIWGATAMVLAEFLTLIGWTGAARIK